MTHYGTVIISNGSGALIAPGVPQQVCEQMVESAKARIARAKRGGR